MNKPLAARLVDFYKDYDFYDYQDTLEVGDTDEDAIKRMDTELSNPEAVASLLAKLKEISQDADLSSEQKEELNFLIAELEKMKSPIDIAKEIIDEYCREEFERDEGADYTNLSEVNVAYTTTEDDKHEIQANVNLVDFKIETLVDGTVIRTEQYDSL